MLNHQNASIEAVSGRKTLRSYVIGYVLSIQLTLIAFCCVSIKFFANTNTHILLAGLAITQLLVQSVCFLRLNNSTEGKWNLLPFLFVIIIITILAGGSLWIMHNLNYNMMI